jgi:hypothetical protein
VTSRVWALGALCVAVSCSWLLHPAPDPLDDFRDTLPVALLFDASVAADDRETVERAARYWNAAIGGEVFETAPYPFVWGTMVFVSVDFDRPKNPVTGREELAVTRFGMAFDGALQDADVVFHIGFENESDADQETTARHELAHVLGLNHIRDRACIMYPTILQRDAPQPACQTELDILRSLYQ